MTLPQLAEMKRNGEPIVMVTAYDYPSAQVAEEAGVDIVLVGDTAAMVVLGYDATTPVGMDEMLMLASAVRRGLETPLLVGDLPFGSYESSNEQAIENAQRFVKEAGCDAVKLEIGAAVGRARPRDRPRRDPRDGPRRPHAADRHRARRLQGAGTDGAEAVQVRRRRARASGGGLLRDRVRGGARGGHRDLMRKLEVPVIGIGAGAATDGQVLVFHDLLGLYTGHTPRFVKRFAEVRGEVEGRPGLRRRGPRAPVPRRRAPHLLDPAGGAGGVQPATSNRRASRAPTLPGTGSQIPRSCFFFASKSSALITPSSRSFASFSSSAV